MANDIFKAHPVNMECIDDILDADPNIQVDDKYLLLMSITRYGRYYEYLFWMMVHHPKINIYVKNESGENALMLSAAYGKCDYMIVLIEAGIDVNSKTKRGSTPMSFAIDNGHEDAIKILADKGAKITLEILRQFVSNIYNDELLNYLILKMEHNIDRNEIYPSSSSSSEDD